MSHQFWENRYKNGGNSGKGSRGLLRLWKWHQIKKFIKLNETDVIDVGCGDMAFWKGKTCKLYNGIDISKFRIEKNRELRPGFIFHVLDASVISKQLIPADAVFCLDMLFHIMDDSSYKKILHNLTLYSKKYIFIYTWRKAPSKATKFTNSYQKYRNFDSYIPIIENQGFKLIAQRKPPSFIDNMGTLWVFRKVELPLPI